VRLGAIPNSVATEGNLFGGEKKKPFCLILTIKYPSPYEGCCGEYSNKAYSTE